MGSRPRLHGGQALCGNNGGGGMGMGPRIRLHGGEEALGGNNGGGGGVPASVFMGASSRWEQRRWGGSRSSRVSVGTTEAGVSRIRLHGGALELSVEVHGRVHPHPNLPPWNDAGGRERRGGVGSLRFYGGGHSAGTMGMGPRIREDNGWGRGREGRVGGWRCGRGGF